jgi:RNA polymerase sigma-70 factor, ECF subfamily
MSGPGAARALPLDDADPFAEARAAWPTVELSADLFALYVAERLPTDQAAGRRLRIADLYLACACVHGDANAIAAFDLHCLTVVDSALPRLGLDADAVGEVKQRLRRWLLVPEAGPPRLVDFAGYGDLRGWVRVIAVHEALAMLRRARRSAPFNDDRIMDALSARDSPEIDYLKHFYRREFKAAFTQAMATLGDRDRTLLRQQYLDGLSVMEMSRLYRVHRITAGRWLDSARRALLSATRAALMNRLDVRDDDVDSILRLICSQLDASVIRLFEQR